MDKPDENNVRTLFIKKVDDPKLLLIYIKLLQSMIDKCRRTDTEASFGTQPSVWDAHKEYVGELKEAEERLFELMGIIKPGDNGKMELLRQENEKLKNDNTQKDKIISELKRHIASRGFEYKEQVPDFIKSNCSKCMKRYYCNAYPPDFSFLKEQELSLIIGYSIINGKVMLNNPCKSMELNNG